MKYALTTLAILASTAAYADDDKGVSGAFGGNVSTFAKSGGVSMTGSMSGYQNTRIRNESGSGEFAGASMSVESGGGSVTMTGESFTDGFDFSKTRAGGGYGGSFAARAGIATSQGGFSGGFSSGDWGGDWGDYDDD